MKPTSNKNFSSRSPLSLLLVGALLPLAAQAHMTWLLPNAAQVSGKEPVVTVDAAISEDLFVFERALKLETLRITGPAGVNVEPDNRSAARHRESFDLKLVKDGTYRISHTSQSVLASYQQGGETKRFRGTPEAFAKEVPAQVELLGLARTFNRHQTFVSKEEPGTLSFSPEGQGMELIPLGPVTDLSDGDNTRFRLLLDGKPLPDATLRLLREGNRYRYKMGEVTVKSDAKGEFGITWAEPGRYWLGANHGERPTNPAPAASATAGMPTGMAGGTRDKPLQRASLSATFEVRPK